MKLPLYKRVSRLSFAHGYEHAGLHRLSDRQLRARQAEILRQIRGPAISLQDIIDSRRAGKDADHA